MQAWGIDDLITVGEAPLVDRVLCNAEWKDAKPS